MSGVEIIDVKQGTPEWLRARRGMPTASRMADIVTPTGKATKNAARRTYLAELVYERLTGRCVERFVTPAMQRGTEAEPKARAWHQMTSGLDVQIAGLVRMTRDWGHIGASPDGLIGEEGGLEIKCPTPVNLVATCLSGEAPEDYVAQVQANLWVTGRAWWDLVLFGPEHGLPKRTWRIPRDATLHEAFEKEVPAFIAEVDRAEAMLREHGAGLTEAEKELQAELQAATDPTRDW